MPELSLVIPLCNEEQNIQPLLTAVCSALTGIDYEVVLVNDGSSDSTVNEVLKCSDERTILVDFDHNYGQSAAMRAGTENSTGQYIAFLDGDLQNDPTDIPSMLQLLKDKNAGMVAGNRKNRQDGLWLRKVPSRIANGLIRLLTGVYVKDYGCTLKILQRKYAEGLQLYGGLHRFIPVLASLQGAVILQTDVKHHARVRGTSKYGLGRTFRVLKDLVLMTALRRFPITERRIAAPAGVISFLLGAVTLITLKLFRQADDPLSNDPFYYPAIILLCAGALAITAKFFLAKMIRAHAKKAALQPYTIKTITRGNSPALQRDR